MTTKKLSKNIVIYGLTNVLKSLVPFIMLPILTAYLAPEALGTLSLIETALLIITPLILLNLEAAVGIEFFQIDKIQLANYIGNGFVLSLLAFILCSFIAFFFKDFIESSFGIDSSLVLILPLFALFRLIPTVVLVLFQSQDKPFTYLGYSVGQTMVDFGLSALFIMHLHHGFIGRLEGIYGAFLIASVIGGLYLLKSGFISFNLSQSTLAKVWSFGSQMIPHAIGGTIIAMSDRYFISFFENNAEVGFYTVAYQLGAIMLLVSMSVNQAWTPMAFSLIKQKAYKKIKLFSIGLLGLFTIVLLGVYFFKDIIFDLIIHENFDTAKAYIPLLLLGFFFQSCYFLAVKYLFYYKKTKTIATITFSGAIVNLILNYILINQLQVLGVAYATAITWFFIFLVTFIVSNKYFVQVDSDH